MPWRPRCGPQCPAAAQEADETPPADTPLTPEESAALGNALLFDATAFAADRPAKPLHLPTLPDAQKFDVKRTDKPDGSSTLVVKQPLASEWDANVGADLNLAPAPSDSYRPAKPLAAASQDSGVAWASVGLPNLASLDARVDPANDQGKLGTTFKHSIPVGGTFSVTLQNTYSVTETLGPPDPAPSDVPLMTMPAPTPPPPQVWDSHNTIKFDVLSTGTSFGAGVNVASNDPRHSQYAERRPETLRPAARDHGGDRSRPAFRQQKYPRRPHAQLVNAGGAPMPPSPRPKAAQVPCGNPSRTGGVGADGFASV